MFSASGSKRKCLARMQFCTAGDPKSWFSMRTLLPIATTISHKLPRICCVILIRENTRPHVADVCKRYLIDTNIETLPWSFLRSISTPTPLRQSTPSAILIVAHDRDNMPSKTMLHSDRLFSKSGTPSPRQSSTGRYNDVFRKCWL